MQQRDVGRKSTSSMGYLPSTMPLHRSLQSECKVQSYCTAARVACGHLWAT